MSNRDNSRVSGRAAAVLGAVVLVGLGAFAVGALTGDDPSSDPSAPSTPTVSESPVPSPSRTAEESETVRVPLSESELWFVHDERLSWGTSAIGGEISADLASDDPVARTAVFWLQLLVAGPMGPYEEAGDTTAIPEGTKLLGVARKGPVLKVDLSSRFESGGGSLSMQLRVAQVVYTGTAFEGIDAVRILIDGERVDAIGGEGIVVADPLSRRDFQDVAPFIVLETPKPGQRIASPVTVAGFANVFEANVTIRIRDENGRVLVETFTTATCGSGCWGDFSEQVAFDVTKRQEGRLEVLTYSAEDGSEQMEASIPVVLLP